MSLKEQLKPVQEFYLYMKEINMENRNKFDFKVCYDKLTLVNVKYSFHKFYLLKQVNHNGNEKELAALKKMDEVLENQRFFLLCWYLTDYTDGTLEYSSGIARTPLFNTKSNIMKSMDG